MRFTISQIVIAVLLFHTAVGCCLHHAHECEFGCGDAATVAASIACCESLRDQCCSAVADRRSEVIDIDGNHHRHQHGCDGDQCTFLRPDRPPTDSIERSLDVIGRFCAWTNQGDAPIGVRFSRSLDFPDPNDHHLIRPHLLLCVLLI